MQVSVLGCYGSASIEKEGSIHKRYHSSCFQVNETTIIDAGSISGSLSISEMAKLRTIFLSHAHLDHIHSLPFVAESLFGKIKQPIVIASTEEVLAALKEHIFNNSIWPDFTAIPNKSHPILRYKTIKPGVPVITEGLKITAISVNHIVPAVGYLVEDRLSAFVYSGDTYQTEEIWDRASRLKSLKAAFIESTFPNRMSALALVSQHLTPALTYQEFLKIKKEDIPLYLYHMKVPYLDEIKKDVKDMPGKKGRLLKDGLFLKF
jgi:ribonuclease BN (tRNA processing enzyme)